MPCTPKRARCLLNQGKAPRRPASFRGAGGIGYTSQRNIYHICHDIVEKAMMDLKKLELEANQNDSSRRF